jgi:hypothetical protein
MHPRHPRPVWWGETSQMWIWMIIWYFSKYTGRIMLNFTTDSLLISSRVGSFFPETIYGSPREWTGSGWGKVKHLSWEKPFSINGRQN